MLKLIVFLLSLFVIGFLIVHDNWMITVSGFGYEATVSTVFLVCLILLVFYLLHLMKKPLVWLGIMQQKMSTARYIKRENYLINVLNYVLNNDADLARLLLKQQKGVFSKKDVQSLIIKAILAPNQEAFEALTKQESFDLAGWRGLYLSALKKGDERMQEKALTAAFENNKTVEWVVDGLYRLSLQKSEWENALNYLEQLKKNGFINKETYISRKADLLMKQNQPVEAFRLNPANVAFAVQAAAAQKTPQKAADILMKAWQLTPAKEIYEAYMALYAGETSAKKMKALKKLIADNPTSRQALSAVADTTVRLELWRDAKETIQVYLSTYPLTKNIACLMAKVVREGWHHEEEAREWENKVVEAEDLAGWLCVDCQQRTSEWNIVCPHCNAYHHIIYG